jgi:hypothetical protein
MSTTLDKRELLNKYFNLLEDELSKSEDSSEGIGKDWRTTLSKDYRFLDLLNKVHNNDLADLAVLFEFGYILAKLEFEEQLRQN